MKKRLLYCIVLFCWTQAGWAEITGDIDLLKVVADRYEANWEKLRTWRGTARISYSVSEGLDEEAVDRRGIYQAEFLVDRPAKANRWKRIPLEEYDSKQGHRNPDSFYTTSGMSKGECDYLMYHYDRGLPTEERSLQIHIRDFITMHFEGTGFDPVRILQKIEWTPIPERLRSYHEKARSPRISPGTVTREGSKVTLAVSQKLDHGTVVERHVFDLAQGGCLLEHYNSSPQMSETHWKLGYEEVSGVFVMNRISLRYEDKRQGRRLISKKTAVLTNEKVNEAIAESEFSLTGLGLKPGDRINDARTPLEYIFGEEGATEADMPPQIIKAIGGQSLPGFEGIQIDLAAAQAKNRLVLVCFADIGQRPSRHCIEELARRTRQFKDRDVCVFVVQDSPGNKQELTDWLKTNGVEFSAGMITGPRKKVHYTWGIHSLPWLILTDKAHTVTHEGITLKELDNVLFKEP